MRLLRTAILALLTLAGAATSATAEIRIAVAGPMTGSLAVLGAQMRDGVTAAIAAINAAGGLLGEELVLEIADDSCSEDRASAVANQLAGAGVVMVVGHLCSAAAIAAAEVYATEQIIQIAPGAPDPRFTDLRPGTGVFRLFGREDDQGSTAAAFLAELPADMPIAVIDDLSAYGDRLADSVSGDLTAAGRPAALSATFSVANPDFAGLVERLIAANIGAVYVAGSAEDVAAILLEMAGRDYDPIVIGGDVLSSTAFAASAGDAANGTLFTMAVDPRLDPAAEEAIAAIEANGGDAAGVALYAYAAVEVWAAAVVATDTINFAAIAASISAETVDTAVGEVAFNANGDLTLPGWAIYQWQTDGYTVYTR